MLYYWKQNLIYFLYTVVLAVLLVIKSSHRYKCCDNEEHYRVKI